MHSSTIKTNPCHRRTNINLSSCHDRNADTHVGPSMLVKYFSCEAKLVINDDEMGERGVSIYLLED